MHKHIIQVSTYQMCILMLFNKGEMFTCEVSMIHEDHLREPFIYAFWNLCFLSLSVNINCSELSLLLRRTTDTFQGGIVCKIPE